MSQDDGLLRRLGELAREEPANGSGPGGLDERWERLAAGTSSPEEEAELRRLAEHSEEARAAYEAYRPLGGDFQAGVVRAIREQAARPARNVLPFRRAATRLAGWTAAAAAAAAALVLLLRPPPLPAYALADLSGGTRATRAEGVGEPDFRPGDRFQVILRPDTAVARAGSLAARAVLVRGREVRALDARTERDPRGSLRLHGVLDGDLSPGEWTIWAVVGRRGALPDADELRSATPDRPLRRRDSVAIPATLRILPRAP